MTMPSPMRVPADRPDGELEPETVLPCQLGDALFDTARLQPEKRLQLAVLQDAVLTLHRCVGNDGSRARRLVAEVDAWFASDATDWPFAFVSICHTLNLDPAYVRTGLPRWRARLEAEADRRLPFRRDQNGTRHQVRLYDTELKRTA
ncbi:MAG: hypothetical protein E6J59_08195 [Deltaproteobacteria bacterium]|nr:MAG: hypothetical protein E6J59_08195 [Deltaproteobacteria bacterium]